MCGLTEIERQEFSKGTRFIITLEGKIQTINYLIIERKRITIPKGKKKIIYFSEIQSIPDDKGNFKIKLDSNDLKCPNDDKIHNTEES